MSSENLRFVRWLDTRMNVDGLPERVCDPIAHGQREDQDGYPWTILFEFQTGPGAQMFGRALDYEGMIWIQENPVQEAG